MLTETNVLTTTEPILLGIGFCVLLYRKTYRNHPAFFSYLAGRLAIYGALSLLLHAMGMGMVEKHLAYKLYYYTFWIGYLAGAGLAFLVMQEIFLHLMEPLKGLGRAGLMIFRWVSLVSVLVALAIAIYPASSGIHQNLLVPITGAIMRCMSVLELCLIAFIVLSMQTLQISIRSRDFAISMGLAMIAAAELYGSAFAFGHSTMNTLANLCCQITVTLAAALWMASLLRTEPSRSPISAEISLQLSKWTEVTGALGKPTPQVVVASSSDFFLQDVEKAVDKILEKNAMRPVN